jgi:hypothetical protein
MHPQQLTTTTPHLLALLVFTTLIIATLSAITRVITRENPIPEPPTLNDVLTHLEAAGHVLHHVDPGQAMSPRVHAPTCWCQKPPPWQPRSRRHKLRIDP